MKNLIKNRFKMSLGHKIAFILTSNLKDIKANYNSIKNYYNSYDIIKINIIK